MRREDEAAIPGIRNLRGFTAGEGNDRPAGVRARWDMVEHQLMLVIQPTLLSWDVT